MGCWKLIVPYTAFLGSCRSLFGDLVFQLQLSMITVRFTIHVLFGTVPIILRKNILWSALALKQYKFKLYN